MPIKFNAVAYFNRPVAGRHRLASTDQGMESVFAETPEAAARMWFWRLGAAERSAVERVIIWPPMPNRVIAAYEGPTIVYRRQERNLIEIERREE